MYWIWTLILISFKLFILFNSLQIILAKNTAIIKGPPNLLSDRTSQQKSVNEGKDIKFSCPIAGNPDPIYEWFKDNNPIPSDSWERFRIQKSTLKIKQVIPEDRGTYKCKGVNGFGSEQFMFHLHIQASFGNVLSSQTGGELKVDQVFPLSGSSITKLPGQSVRFKCFVTGDPEPDITWYKNGRLLNPFNYDPDPSEYETIRSSKYFLHIPYLTSWDSGNYTCEAMNIHWTITVNWTLNVVAKVPPEKSEVFPLQLSNISAFSGEDAVLRCRGTWDSEISPKVKWLRQIDPIQLYKIPENETFSYRGKYYQVVQPTELVLEDGHFLTKLLIRKAHLHDSGIYVCTATNRYGLNIKEANLSVIEADSNFGHLILVVSLSLVVFIIVTVSVIVTLRRRKAKRLPPHHSSSLVTEHSKVPMEPYVRPLLPPPLISDHGGELQPRYVVYPPTISPQPRPLDDLTKATSASYDGSSNRLHSNMGLLGPHPQSSDGSKQGQPVIVYQDTPRSMYVSANRCHLQNFDVI